MRVTTVLSMCSLAVILAACGDGSSISPDGALIDGGVDAGPPPDPRPAARPLTQWVDPFVGTGGVGFNDTGSTYPGPAVPFGMIHPGPDSMNETGAPVTTCARPRKRWPGAEPRNWCRSAASGRAWPGRSRPRSWWGGS